jgi:hypothetical protein
LTPSAKPLGLISTFAPIGMLDLGWTLALTPSVKWVLSSTIYQMFLVALHNLWSKLIHVNQNLFWFKH